MSRSEKKTYRTERIVFDGFSLSKREGNFLCATDSHGCRTKGGALVHGVGVKYLQIDGVDIAMSYSNTYRLSFVPYITSIGKMALPMYCDPKRDSK